MGKYPTMPKGSTDVKNAFYNSGSTNWVMRRPRNINSFFWNYFHRPWSLGPLHEQSLRKEGQGKDGPPNMSFKFWIRRCNSVPNLHSICQFEHNSRARRYFSKSLFLWPLIPRNKITTVIKYQRVDPQLWYKQNYIGGKMGTFCFVNQWRIHHFPKGVLTHKVTYCLAKFP